MKTVNLKNDASRDEQIDEAKSTKLLSGQHKSTPKLEALAEELGTLVGRHLAQDSKSEENQ